MTANFETTWDEWEPLITFRSTEVKQNFKLAIKKPGIKRKLNSTARLLARNLMVPNAPNVTSLRSLVSYARFPLVTQSSDYLMMALTDYGFGVKMFVIRTFDGEWLYTNVLICQHCGDCFDDEHMATTHARNESRSRVKITNNSMSLNINNAFGTIILEPMGVGGFRITSSNSFEGSTKVLKQMLAEMGKYIDECEKARM